MVLSSATGSSELWVANESNVIMDFFDRKSEIGYLRSERDLSKKVARMTVVTGRRRVGKTQLIQRAMGDEPYLYFLVTRRAETDQCADFIEKATDAELPGEGAFVDEAGNILGKHKGIIRYTVGQRKGLGFWKVDEGIFGDIQEQWDRYHAQSKINLVTCGSVNTMMNRIFFDDGQPLYGRSTSRLHLDPFALPVIRDILASYNKNWTPDDLLALWTFTGGVARYVEELMDRGFVTKDAMIDGILGEHSYFFDEGKSVLVQEFGKEYGTYFSILSAIARGVTTRNEIEQIVGTSVGGYLTRLETDYGLVARRQPLFESSSSKSSRYRMTDNFFSFWFRFVFKNADLIELKRFDLLRDILRRDYETFSGIALEGYFRQKFVEERRYTKIGGWWDRRGENEIDLVCDDSVGNRLDFYEVKRDESRIDLKRLQEKSVAFFQKNPDMKDKKVSFLGLSLRDMKN